MVAPIHVWVYGGEPTRQQHWTPPHPSGAAPALLVHIAAPELLDDELELDDELFEEELLDEDPDELLEGDGPELLEDVDELLEDGELPPTPPPPPPLDELLEVLLPGDAPPGPELLEDVAEAARPPDALDELLDDASPPSPPPDELAEDVPAAELLSGRIFLDLTIAKSGSVIAHAAKQPIAPNATRIASFTALPPRTQTAFSPSSRTFARCT